MPETAALQEATATLGPEAGQQGPGRLSIRLIQGDVQGSSGYYPAAMLKRDGPKVFTKGTQMYVNHPTITESVELPERSVYDLAGVFTTDARYEGDGLYAEVELAPHHRWIEGVKDMIGMSIRASGTVEPSQVESIRGPLVTSITHAESVDFVTAAGAGGKIVALLESARKEAEDEALAASLLETEAKLVEGRNIGAHMEARIHRDFTNHADGMYGDGRLTRPERIGLSKAIGKGLDAFTAHIEAEHPQLYTRDLWTDPAAATMAEARRLRESGPLTAGELSAALADAVRETYGGDQIYTWVRDNTAAWVVFTVEDATDCDMFQQAYTVDADTQQVALAGEPVEVIARTTYEPAPPEQVTNGPDGEQITENATGTPPTNPDEEGHVPELTEAQVKELTDARDKAFTEAATAKAEAADATAKAEAALAEAAKDRAAKAAADLQLARFTASEAAWPIAATLLVESGLPSPAQTRILTAVTAAAGVPLTDLNVLDEATYRTSVSEAIKAEQSYLASLQEGDGLGTPRGLGAPAPAPQADQAANTQALVNVYMARGLSESAAKLAAAGRGV